MTLVLEDLCVTSNTAAELSLDAVKVFSAGAAAELSLPVAPSRAAE